MQHNLSPIYHCADTGEDLSWDAVAASASLRIASAVRCTMNGPIAQHADHKTASAICLDNVATTKNYCAPMHMEGLNISAT